MKHYISIGSTVAALVALVFSVTPINASNSQPSAPVSVSSGQQGTPLMLSWWRDGYGYGWRDRGYYRGGYYRWNRGYYCPRRCWRRCGWNGCYTVCRRVCY